MLRRLLIPFRLCAFILAACGDKPAASAPAAVWKNIKSELLQISTDDDWPNFGYDAGHTGYAAAQGNGAPLQGKLLWSRRLGPIFSAVSGKQIYIGSGNGFFYALDVVSGRPDWSYSAGEIRASAALAGGRLYVGSLDGTSGEVYAFV